jgi:nucleotide-binding universal stress UspA family protein
MDQNLVVIATYNYSRALLLRGRLESEGIESYLTNIDLVQLETSSGVKVLIKEEDVAAATRIIKSISIEYGESEALTKPSLYKIHRILVPVDFSEHSLIACDYAAALASRVNAEIKIVHGYYDPPSVAAAFPDAFSYELGMGGLQKDLENIAKAEIKVFKEKVLFRARNKGILDLKISTVLVQGTIEDEVQAVARKYKPHMIVIANKGKDRTIDKPVGHVTADLIDHSNFPVFAIPEQAAFKQFENNNLLYLTDFDDPDFSAFRKLMSIVSPYNMKVFCIHVGDQSKNTFDNVQMEELQDKISLQYPDFPVQCHMITDSDLVTGVNGFIQANQIDIIAMSNRKHSFIYRLFNESNARKMLYNSPVPMLVFQIKD